MLASVAFALRERSDPGDRAEGFRSEWADPDSNREGTGNELQTTVTVGYDMGCAFACIRPEIFGLEEYRRRPCRGRGGKER